MKGNSDASIQSRTVYYPLMIGYYSPIWCGASKMFTPWNYRLNRFRSARLSILFTIVRFTPRVQQKKVLGCESLRLFIQKTPLDPIIGAADIAGIVLLQWLFLMIEATWFFERDNRAWKGHAGTQPAWISISQVISASFLRRFSGRAKRRVYDFSHDVN